jgi:hypothetical protein
MPVGPTRKRCDSFVRNLKKGNSAKMGVRWAPIYSSAFHVFVNNRMPGRKWQFKCPDFVHTTTATTTTITPNTTTTAAAETATTEINVAASLLLLPPLPLVLLLASTLSSWLEVSPLVLIIVYHG